MLLFKSNVLRDNVATVWDTDKINTKMLHRSHRRFTYHQSAGTAPEIRQPNDLRLVLMPEVSREEQNIYGVFKLVGAKTFRDRRR